MRAARTSTRRHRRPAQHARIGFGDACAYIVMQLAGAVVAVLVVKALMNTSGEAAHFGAVEVVTGKFLEGSTWRGMLAEGIGTFFLMWAIMGTVVNPAASARGVHS